MKAALVTSFDRPPAYVERAEPTPEPGEIAVSVTAAAVSQLVKAQAAGKHYSVRAEHLPFVPGVDGVGRLEDGRRVYFAFPRLANGAMAERTVVRASYTVELPDEVDDVTAAAIANPGMSSWAALTHRARLERGESVLVNGATGASGKLAIRIAKHLGAKRVLVTGRTQAKADALLALGADGAIGLDHPHLGDILARELRSIDVVLDYLWGASAEQILRAVRHGQWLRFVQIGSLAGNDITLSSTALRSSKLELMGSGLGSVSNDDLVESIRGVMRAVKPAGLSIETETASLSDVSSAWTRATAKRLVLVA